ncbi:nitronate monooxygenase family protein [Oceanicoccus sp. KOV_DT_Chl]|uniref:NAD(P)H-dependent flavin oxidoreductase n=1 Tax=Oceanicoccus sp. KOV_DT_Chl TaxID=1904639 RepID=UPI000C7B837F|nr:nitronate monooxygenase [Oceanicoccus sp. KOV_DT_Chl]
MYTLTQELDIHYPIFNAGMAFIAGPELASAVTNSGGLGFLGAGILPVPLVSAQYKAAKSASHQGPIGVDFLMPFFTEDHLAFILSEKPAVAAFFFGLPEAEQLQTIQQQGTRVWAIVNSLEEARHAQSLQADAIVLQGSQAGGHNKASLSVEELFKATYDALPDIPLIIAGGIVNGLDVKQALDKGAQGVWCGTVFLASVEANAHPDYKKKVIDCEAGQTQISTAFGPEWPDQPMRVYQNTAVKALGGKVDHPHIDCIGTSYIGGQPIEMPRYSAILPMADTQGDVDLMALTMGTEAARIQAIRPVSQIIAQLSEEITVAQKAYAV